MISFLLSSSKGLAALPGAKYQDVVKDEEYSNLNE
jgi:hypothetical protein